MIEEILMQNGFSEKEAKVYVAVLEVGEATVAQIGQKAHLKRTTVYDILEPMRDRGIVSITKRKGSHRVSALPPQTLIDRFKRSATIAENALPQMLELAYSSPLKPRMRFYEGIDGVKDILREMSYSHEETVGFTDYALIPPDIFRFIRREIVPSRRSRGNRVRFILPKNERNVALRNENAIHYADHRLVTFPRSLNHVAMLTFNYTKTGFISYHEHELFGVELDSTAIHDTVRNVFELVWATAK